MKIYYIDRYDLNKKKLKTFQDMNKLLKILIFSRK